MIVETIFPPTLTILEASLASKIKYKENYSNYDQNYRNYPCAWMNYKK